MKVSIKIIIAAVKNFAVRHKGLVIPLAIVAGGILIMSALIMLKEPPVRENKVYLAPLVKAVTLRAEDIKMSVSGYGTVTPKVQVEIVPQVGGKVVEVNPRFKAGGFISGAEPIVKIDPRDYELAVEQAQAVVAKAEVQLDQEKAEAKIALAEWQQLNPGTEPSSPLVLREPQIRQAQAEVKSAKATLAVAQLNLERTEVSLPLDVMVTSERIDLGQYVMAGMTLGSAYGIEAVEIELPLQDKNLAWFEIGSNPVAGNGDNNPASRTRAKVIADFAGAKHIWHGYVTRTTGQVDIASRLVSVVIEVPKPVNPSENEIALLPGMFVEVVIEGNVLKNTIAVPRQAVRNGDTVWVLNDGMVHIQKVAIARSDKDFAYVVSGLDSEAEIIVSSLDAVTEGMKVRLQNTEND